MAELVTLKLWLAEAEVARHQLATGRRAVSVSYDGKSTSFTAADMSKLDQYITSLKQQIGMLEGTVPPRGPVHFTF